MPPQQTIETTFLTQDTTMYILTPFSEHTPSGSNNTFISASSNNIP